ncbi:MAG: DUF3037 domain-containing protein [Bryobacteraceae bacterium]|nr:DUF3037 domain-containing protein [Bryobacteraceae bacterium]
MPALSSFDYAVLRVVPRVEREEFINAGVIFFCLHERFLAARVHLNEDRLEALWPGADAALVRLHLEAFPNVCAGRPDAGPIASLSLRERFHWLVAPRSTMIQISAVHTGLCEDPEAALSRLFHEMVPVGELQEGPQMDTDEHG